MIYDIVKKRPADPPAYALKWLQDFLGNILLLFQSRGKRQRKILAHRPATRKQSAMRSSSIARKMPPAKGVESASLNKYLGTSTKKTQLNSE